MLQFFLQALVFQCHTNPPVLDIDSCNFCRHQIHSATDSFVK